MVGKKFGQTIRTLEKEKTPPLWKIVLGMAIAAALLSLMTLGLFSLEIPPPSGLIR